MSAGRTRRSRLMLTVCVTLVATLAPLGCSGGSRVDPQSPTGGLSLKMLVLTQDNAAAMYRVEPDGTIHFGGGLDARQEKTTWSGPMTAQEIQQLRDLIAQHGWYDAGPVSTDRPPGRSYRIQLRWPQGRRTFRVLGRSLDVTPIEQLLAHAAGRRHDAFLDTLPKPSSEQVRPESPNQSDR